MLLITARISRVATQHYGGPSRGQGSEHTERRLDRVDPAPHRHPCAPHDRDLFARPELTSRWRITPMPGSPVGTRRISSPSGGVPSANVIRPSAATEPFEAATAKADSAPAVLPQPMTLIKSARAWSVRAVSAGRSASVGKGLPAGPAAGRAAQVGGTDGRAAGRGRQPAGPGPLLTRSRTRPGSVSAASAAHATC